MCRATTENGGRRCVSHTSIAIEKAEAVQEQEDFRLNVLKNLQRFVKAKKEQGIPYAVALRQFSDEYGVHISNYPPTPAKLDRALTGLKRAAKKRKLNIAVHRARMDEMGIPVTLQEILAAERRGDISHAAGIELPPRDASIAVEEMPFFSQSAFDARMRGATTEDEKRADAEWEEMNESARAPFVAQVQERHPKLEGTRLDRFAKSRHRSAFTAEKKDTTEARVRSEYAAHLTQTAPVLTAARGVHASEWTHPETGEQRWYVDRAQVESIMGFEVETHKSGSLSSVKLNGEQLSNTQGAKALSTIGGKWFLTADESERGWALKAQDSERVDEVRDAMEAHLANQGQ
jgi:hypothetical protein